MFQKQIMMRRVLYALAPIFFFSVYLYGWRSIVITGVSVILGVFTEYLMEKGRNKKISEAVLVSCVLYALSLPPKTPLWVVGVGIVFAVFFGKEVYGGFGRNVFNPALTGRLFVYITFATVLSASWMVPGGFGAQADAVASATPLALLLQGKAGELHSLDLLLGLRAGTLGESSVILILLAAVYLIATKTASWRIILSTAGSAAVFSFVLDFLGVKGAFPALASMMSGSVLFVAVFMATDPVSAPKKPLAQWIYGVMIGTVAILLRLFSAFPEGTSFAVLVGNTFACLLDEVVGSKTKEAA